MSKRRGWMTVVMAGALASATLAGCVVEPARVRVGVGVPLVVTAPPAPVVETYGPPPAVGYVWLGGYWNWAEGRHVWVPGRWAAPRPGYRWVPHRWIQERGGWRLHEGHWERH